MVTADGLRRDAVRAMVTADGLHRDAVHAMVTADLQQMEHTHRGCVETCMLGVRTCNGYSRARPEFAVYSAFKSFLLLYT